MTSCQVGLALAVLCGVLGSVLCAPQGYLPPSKPPGYDYPTPKLPFPDTPVPSRVPYPTPPPRTPTYGPPPKTPTYGPPPSIHTDEHEHEHHHHHEPGMPFDFDYKVKEVETGNDYSHNAVSDGDITRGEYRVQLPDGRLQIVTYTADWKNGFNAKVTYEGVAKYPEPKPQPYGPPTPSYGPPTGGYKY